MPPTRAPIDAPTREGLRALVALALVLCVFGALLAARPGAPPLGLRLFVAGLVLLAIRFVPPIARPIAKALQRVLDLVGAAVSTVILTVLYVVVLWPYHLLLVRLGAITSPDAEPWPPPAGHSGWTALDWGEGKAQGRARVGNLWAALVVRAGGAAALVRFLQKRPAYFLVPVVMVLLVLFLFVFLGSATGLGPLVYTLF